MAIKLEIEQVANSSKDNDFINFLHAASTGSLDILQEFIFRRPHDINKEDETYRASATHFAAKFNQLEALQFLVSHGATLGRMTNQNLNELHYGVGSVAVTEFILEQNPDLIESRGQNGFNALDCAIHHESVEVADLLRHKMLEISSAKQFESKIAKDHAEEIIAAAQSITPNSTFRSQVFKPIKEESQRTATQGK